MPVIILLGFISVSVWIGYQIALYENGLREQAWLRGIAANAVSIAGQKYFNIDLGLPALPGPAPGGVSAMVSSALPTIGWHLVRGYFGI